MEIIREAIFDEQIKEISDTYARMHWIDNAIDWMLVRDPMKIDNLFDLGDDVYLWTTDEFSGNRFPKLRIAFEYKPEINQVTLMGLQVIETT